MRSLLALSLILISILASSTRTYSLDYSITDLGTVSVSGINSLGQILGNSSTGAFIWSNGTMNVLGSFKAENINNSGQVVGWQGNNLVTWQNGSLNTVVNNGQVDAFNVNTDSLRTFRTQTYADFIAINDAGNIFTTATSSSSAYIIGYISSSSTWQYRPAPDTFLLGANNANQVIGYTNSSSSNNAFVIDNFSSAYSGSPYIRLSDIMGEHQLLNNINDNGQIVGVRWNNADDLQDFNQASLWQNGTRIDLSGGKVSQALDINNTGEVVGDIEGRATIWDSNGVAMDLNTLLTGSGWILTEATAINDLGQIVGTGIINGEIHSFLLNPDDPTPVPEPGNFSLVCAGLCVLVFRKIRCRGKLSQHSA